MTTTATHEVRDQATAHEQAAGSLEWRFRLVVSSLALVALAFLQKPGMFVADTKLDLAVAPGALLGRALHMWDAEGAFGQLQNQGYGYLFPMGPFFWLGDLVGMPGWAVQRAWYALVLVVAFVGLVKLAGALGIGSPLTRLIGGFAFALSPRLLTTLGPISIEAWPSALAPWVLLPLVYGSRRGSPVRAAALSAVAISCIGGVNAAAAAAVLPLPALWLLTREPGRRRRLMMLWWPVFTLMGTLWWLVPLFLLGAYSPPFLDFIERAQVTTFPTTIFDALRGTSHWVPYVEPDWQGGHLLISQPYLIIDTSVLAALGLAGLCWARTPHRGFLVGGLLTGLVLVTAGHVGAVQGWMAQDVHAWLDGVLSPLRNVHKFDVIIRLPLVLGLTHLLGVACDRAARAAARSTQRRLHAGLVAACVVALVGGATPLLADRATRTGEFQSIPAYWLEAAGWLGSRQGATYALLVPGSAFGDYVWGYPADEPLQPLAVSPWAVRNAIPLAPPGNIRMLDAVESRLNTGEASPGLASFLARAGVEFLVVRNDLTRSDDVPDPLLVHQALRGSPGISLEATFGPSVGGEPRLDDGSGPRVTVNQGWQNFYPAVEIYRVANAHRAVATVSTPVVVGGPEDLLQLTDLGVIHDEPTVLAVDAERARPERLILTDGLRLRATSFGRVHDNDSVTLTPEQAATTRRSSREYVLGSDDRWATRARLEGVRNIRASSSRSDQSGRRSEPEHSPFAAVDGDPRTSWISGDQDGSEGPWLELEFEEPIQASRLALTLGSTSGAQQRLQVMTDSGLVAAPELKAGRRTWVDLGTAPIRRLRIGLDEELRTFGERLDVAEIEIPGVRVTRPLVLPMLPSRWPDPDTIVLSATDGYTSGCVAVAGDVRCAGGRAAEGEHGAVLDRIVRVRRPATFSASVVAAPRHGPELDALLNESLPTSVSASSSKVDDPRGGALAAVDGGIGTTWIADPRDKVPSLTLSWGARRRVTEISVDLDESAAAARPRAVELLAGQRRRIVRLDADGRGTFRPLSTDEVVIRFKRWQRGSDLGFDGSYSALPVGVGELRLAGVESFPVALRSTPRRMDCGSGPSLVVNGSVVATALVASPGQLFRGDLLEAKVCTSARLRLREGENRIVARPGPGVRADALVLDSAGSRKELPVVPVSLRQDTSDSSPVSFRIAAPTLPVPRHRDGAVVIRQNVNAGWQAWSGSTPLKPLTVDGWQQAWKLRPGERGPISVEFLPDRPYRAALLVGLALALLLIGLAVGTRAAARLPGSGSRYLPGWVTGGLATLTLGLVAGVWGVAALLVALAVVRLLAWRRWLWLAPVLAATALLASSLLYAVKPWGDASGWAGSGPLPQVFAVLAVAVVVAVALGERGLPARRMKGRSTHQ